MSKSTHYKFKQNARIGSNDALEDKYFLEECFLDTGKIEILRNTQDPRCIIVGRTGSGKTALIEQISAEMEKCVKIEPDQLSLSYLVNNQAIKFFNNLGIDLDQFYKLLWRHIFIVEIISMHYKIKTETQRKDVIGKITRSLEINKNKKIALEYLLEWGDEFWNVTDRRVKETTEKLETQIKKGLEAKLGGTLANISALADNITTLSQEEKLEITNIGQEIVNNIQISKISDVIRILKDDIINDRKKKYYITIDKLDENWIDNQLRYRLIRSLFETVKSINNQLDNVKIIVTMREDLLARVFAYTRDDGYQEEKYKSLYLPLKWSKAELEKVLDYRINYILKDQYTNNMITSKDVLPRQIDNENNDTLSYLIERTLYRPRDIISFFNECLTIGRTKITVKDILDAERNYSVGRLNALSDEWFSDYPNLIEYIYAFLYNKNYMFTFSSFNSDNILESITKYESRLKEKSVTIPTEKTSKNMIKDSIDQFYENENVIEFVKKLLRIFVHVGAVGIYNQDGSKSWGYDTDLTNSINETNRYIIHKAFYKVFNINQ